MRVFIVIVATFLLLAGGFAIYSHFQTTADSGEVASTQALPPPAKRVDSESVVKIHEGDDVWMVRYDQQTGQVVSEFRAAHYQPRKDGTVNVQKPEAKFYLANKQLLHIGGADGDVVIPDNGGSPSGGLANQNTFPTRGQLRDVRIELYDNQKGEGTPSLVATLNNASFDNDTFRIYSEGFTGPDGKYVEPDQVPVTVRGVDYDFDGRGLTIRWNERDQHLQLLEIAHGEKLVVKNPSKMSMPMIPATRPSARIDDDPEDRVMLAAADKNAAINAIPSPKKGTTTRSTKQPAVKLPGKPKIVPRDKNILYRATFFDNVRITQADQGTITGDQLKVDFLSDNPNQKSSDSPTTRPSTRATTAPSARAATVATTSDVVASSAPAVPAPPTASATTVASTQPAQQPITVFWTGKLQVIPLDSDTGDEGLQTGQAIARMTGSPVVISRQDSRIECASLRYDTSGSRLLLEESPTVKLVMSGPNGERVTSATMDYSMEDRRAVLGGRGSMVTKLEQDAAATQPTTQPAPMLTAGWSDSCTLHFSSADAREQMSIERVELLGDVHIVHPQMDLKSHHLDVGFAPRGGASIAPDAPTTAPTTPSVAQVQGSIRDLTADGDVKCTMTESSDKPQTIECDHLVLASATAADGKLYPRTVTADGQVHTSDGQQDLHAKHLVVTLAPPEQKIDDPTTQSSPTTSPSNGIPPVALERLEAQGDVKTVTKDGAIAYADQLFVTMQKQDQPHVRLVGNPSAKVVDKETTVTGPVIDLFPKDQHATITGAGTLHAIQEPTNAGATTRPVDVTWSEGAYVEGAKNQIDVNGKVVATTMQDANTTNVARGEKLRLILADAPSTQPTSRPATVPSASFASTADATNAFGNKVVRTIILSDHALVDSDEVAPADGALQRRVHLSADEIRYETQTDSGEPRRQVRIPVSGQMLYEDRRGPTTQPAPTVSSSNNALGDSRGATAFQWQKQFVYDDATRRATMTGDVVIVHKPADESAGIARLNAAEVIAEFAPAGSNGSAPPPTTQNANEPRVELKRMQANGAVHFEARDISFDAETIDYDPATKVLTARGSTHRPARLFDEKGLSKGSFSQLRYNTQTSHVDSLTDFVAEARQGSGRRIRSNDEN